MNCWVNTFTGRQSPTKWHDWLVQISLHYPLGSAKFCSWQGGNECFSKSSTAKRFFLNREVNRMGNTGPRHIFQIKGININLCRFLVDCFIKLKHVYHWSAPGDMLTWTSHMCLRLWLMICTALPRQASLFSWWRLLDRTKTFIHFDICTFYKTYMNNFWIGNLLEWAARRPLFACDNITSYWLINSKVFQACSFYMLDCELVKLIWDEYSCTDSGIFLGLPWYFST